jgi:hypothetical protein
VSEEMKKQSLPRNSPSIVCENCRQPAPAMEKWTNDNQGKLFLATIDAWPTYYRDVDGIRVEFCSCECGVAWMQKNLLSP